MDIVWKDRTFDSLRANNANANEPLIELKTPIADVVGACVISASVPFTYYVFDSTTNQFKLGSTTVTIPEQTMNSNNLYNELSAAITKAGVSSPGNYVFFVDSTTSKLVIYNTAGTSFTLDFSIANSCYAQLGFSNTTYSSSLHSDLIAAGTTVYDNAGTALTSTYHVLVAPYCVALSGPNQMYVHCRYLGPAMNGAITNDSNSADIIGDFRVNTNYQGTITYENPAPVMYECQMPSVKKVHLYLTVGSNTSALDLRGQTYQVKIRFFCRKRQSQGYGVDAAGNANIASVGSGASYQMRNDRRYRVSGSTLGQGIFP